MAFPTYGKLLFNGFNQERGSSTLRTEMEDSFVKENGILSRVLVPSAVQYLFTKSEFASFKSWFAAEANGGQFFAWVDPLDGLEKQVRMVGSRYTARPENAGEGQPLNVIVSFTLEEWTS